MSKRAPTTIELALAKAAEVAEHPTLREAVAAAESAATARPVRIVGPDRNSIDPSQDAALIERLREAAHAEMLKPQPRRRDPRLFTRLGAALGRSPRLADDLIALLEGDTSLDDLKVFLGFWQSPDDE